jgi:hypothetical protein
VVTRSDFRRTAVCKRCSARLPTISTRYELSPVSVRRARWAGDERGTIDSPWDLSTALAHPPEVRPGDTIWLRGGTYEGHFKSRLIGTRAARITLRGYSGERPTLADNRTKAGGGTLEIWGSWTDYRDFEITNKNPNRRF